MVSFIAISDWRAALANGGWWFIWLTFFGTFALAVFEHRKLKEDYKAASGRHKSTACFKLTLLWTLPVLSLIAAAASQWGSEKAEQKIARLETDLREERSKVEQNDPLNAPINSASAVLRLKVKEVKKVPWDTPGSGVFAPPTEDESGTWGNGGIVFSEGTNLGKQIYRLTCGAWDIGILGSGLVGGPEDCRGVTVNLHDGGLDTFEFLGSTTFEQGQPVKVFKDIGNFVISLPQMQTNVSVVSGTVEIKVNASRWKFPVPSQTQRYGILSSQLTNDAQKGLGARVMNVPIADWVSPPRFTNRVYTGEPD